VPYKGAAAALADVMSGHMESSVGNLAGGPLAAIKAGRVRALGITSPKRSALAPDLPPIAETVPGYEWGGWYGIAAPKGTPAPIVAKLNAEQLKALGTPEFQEKLAALGAEPIGSTPQAFDAFMVAQVEKMRLAIRLSGARPE
jgi:tripartite-type tricarboxylate transporter receptor subunit TctC